MVESKETGFEERSTAGSPSSPHTKRAKIFPAVLKESIIAFGLSLALIIFFLTLHSSGLADAAQRLKLATTTSTDNSGLLEAILPAFEKKSGIKVDVIAVGTGKALKLGENGDVDVVLVHAPEAEKKFVRDGFGVYRQDVMYNDFIILGPQADPAGLKAAKTASDALKRVAEKGVLFASRGDDSGTDKKEKQLWRQAGMNPGGKRYLEVGKGMAETIFMADELGAYTLSDRATYLAIKDKISIRPVFEGDSALFNPYGVIAVNPARHPGVNYSGAKALIDWIISPEGQTLIHDYKKHGQKLFHPSGKGAGLCK